MERTRLIAVLAGAICAVAGCLSAPADADERYPVWWAPEIGIASLDEIDTLLAGPFPEEFRHKLYKFDYARGKRVSPIVDQQPIENCLSLFEWMSAGYTWGVDDRDELLAYRRAYPYCYTLRALKRAKPPTASYVRDFVMDLDTLDYMPTLLGYWWCSPRSYPRVVRANRGGIPWNRFDFRSGSGGYGVAVVKDSNVFVLQAWGDANSHNYDEVFAIIGRGDFNNDGLDDLLLRMTSVRLSSGRKRSELFLLSRSRAEDVLRVAEVLSPLISDRNGCVPEPYELWPYQ